ncbi:MAG: hypothetical protein VZS44_05175 [Bacilli bacterium]|nr:hypothetical protein [Bacilli bacterium]
MKKFIVGIFSFILLNLFILLAFNMNVKNIMNDLINSSGMDKQINNLLSIYFNKNGIDVVDEKDIDDIVDKYMDMVINNEDEEASDLIVDIINKKREKIKSYGVKDEEIDRIIYEIEANVSGDSNKIDNYLSNEKKIGLMVYKMISSHEIRNYTIIGIMICCLMLLIINKLVALKDIGISLFAAGVLIKGAEVLLEKILMNDDIKEKIGDVNLNFSGFDNFIYIYIASGVILIVMYIFYYFIKKDKKA